MKPCWHNPLWRFLGAFVLAIGLLIAPWPGLEENYAKALRSAADLVFRHFGAKGLVVFRPNDEPGDTLHDTKIFLGNRDMLQPGGQLSTVSVKFSTRYSAYLPTALVMALVVATPIPWRRRLLALLWGLLWANGFVVFVLWIMILHQYSESGAIGLYQLTGGTKMMVKAGNEIFVGYIGAYFAVPVFIWIAVAFRRDDWTKILGSAANLPSADSKSGCTDASRRAVPKAPDK